MNQYLEQAQQWWLDRTEQEQRLLTLLVPVLVVGLFYWLAWAPIANGKAQAEQAVQVERAALASIKDNAVRYVGQKGSDGPRRNGGGSLNQIASRATAAHGLTIARMQPQGDKLQLWLEDTSFEKLLACLVQLNRDHGITVAALDLTKADEEGLVQVRRLQLARP